MKKILAIGVALGALAAASGAIAADIPGRKSAPAPFVAPPLFTWTGFYAGVNAGAAFGNSSTSGLQPIGFPAANAAALSAFGGGGGNNNTRFAGGGQIGYNYQIGQIVVGIEADLDFITRGGNGSNNGSVVLPVAFGGIGATTVTTNGSSRNNSYFGTVRPRVGYAFDRFLVYVTGGIAYGDYNNRRTQTVTFRDSTGAFLTSFSNGGGSNNRIGYALGAGVEYAITNNWTVRGEYLYLGDSRKNNRTLTSPATAAFFNANSGGNKGLNVIRAAVNYKF